MPGRILDALTNGELKWEDVGPVYDEFHYPDGFSIQFPNNYATFAETLKTAFPHEADAIDAYLTEVRGLSRVMRNYWLSKVLPGKLGQALGGWMSRSARAYVETTAARRLEQLFRDPKLRTVVAGQWGYHGSPPSEASWALQALIVRHFAHGAAYPVGGSPSIALGLLKTVADAGGWTRIVADVEQVLIEGGRAVGVRMADGEEIRAERVVSAIGAWSTVTRLLPEAVANQSWANRIERLQPSAAHVSLYLGFKGDIAAAGATRQCQWFYNTWHHDQAVWDVHPDRPVGKPPILFTSYPSLKDPEHDPGPEQRHTGEIVTFVPWEVFQRWKDTPWRQRGEDYEAFKREMSERILEVLFERRPELAPLLDHHELSTPLSTDLFCRPYKGSIYGLAATPERFEEAQLRPQTPIPGLFLSGSDVAACGVVGAMMGGLICGVAMEPVAGVRYLHRSVSRKT
jgi:all-trans-retinol 13,14-reductase